LPLAGTRHKELDGESKATHSFAALLAREPQAVAGEIDAVCVVHDAIEKSDV
jgi:hypothetical protein